MDENVRDLTRGVRESQEFEQVGHGAGVLLSCWDTE